MKYQRNLHDLQKITNILNRNKMHHPKADRLHLPRAKDSQGFIEFEIYKSTTNVKETPNLKGKHKKKIEILIQKISRLK